MNNREREMWIDNDERLYRAWKASGMSKRAWIWENRKMIDEVINKALMKDGV